MSRELIFNTQQTPKGFPAQKRPKVISVFFRNAHKYERDYGLQAKSLGVAIMGWWEEIKSTGVRFGGPTGIYTFIVLMSWWCSLLEGRPNGELVDCLSILNDTDQTIISAIRPSNGQPRHMPAIGDPPSVESTTTPVRQPRGSKRKGSEGSLSRKRARTDEA